MATQKRLWLTHRLGLARITVAYLVWYCCAKGCVSVLEKPLSTE